MINRETVREHLLAYLNASLTLAVLVDWAENAVMEDEFTPDEDIEMLMEIMTYLAGSDTEYFPLTWDVITEFLEQLGTRVRVVAEY